MFDCRPIQEPIVLGDGKKLVATKIGKLRRTVLQSDGSTRDIVLNDVKLVPGLDMPLFGILKALSQGWRIANKGVHLRLMKKGVAVEFDRVTHTATGQLVGVSLLPRSTSSTHEYAMPAQEEKSTKIWNINRFHQVFNHSHEEALRKTAKAYEWKVTGKLEPCSDCARANAKQKNVPKISDTKATEIAERVYIDTTSVQHKSLGGAKHLLGVVDDKSDFTWVKPLKRKKDQVHVMLSFLRKMKTRGKPVKYIRCDNAGENRDLRNKCKESHDLNDITFEFTARESPQFNGKIERKFATMWNRARVNNLAAKLSSKLKKLLWAEACSTAIDVENFLVSSNHEDPSHREFFREDMPHMDQPHQFGEMAIMKSKRNYQGKLEDRGIPVLYLGRARDHAPDTHRLLNLQTKLVFQSRDVIWLNQVHGDCTGSVTEQAWDSMAVLPKSLKEGQPQDMVDQQPQQEPIPQTQQEPTPQSVDGKLWQIIKLDLSH